MSARIITSFLALSVFFGASSAVWAGAKEQAKRIHDRLTGVPPSAAVLADMEADISAGDAVSAAYTAMENKYFYNVTLKNWVIPWTNRDRTVFADLNDFTATIIGMVRDDEDFRNVLIDDVLYVGSSGLGLPTYSTTNNNHYAALEEQNVDLKTHLVKTTQSSLLSIPSTATAGVMTTRAGAKAFFIAGTNRAMFRFTLLNFLCKDLENVADTTRPPDRIRQDVTRSPGGDSRLFLNNCVGCHSGMDPMAQAFAYYDFEYDVNADPEGLVGRLVYNDAGMTDATTGTRVKKKYHINENNFKYGFVTPDDRWDNYWRKGVNTQLGWSGSLNGYGNGAKELGRELAYSEAFARCQVEKAFQVVCLRAPVDSADRTQIDSMVTSFKSASYNIKRPFAEAANYCKGE